MWDMMGKSDDDFRHFLDSDHFPMASGLRGSIGAPTCVPHDRMVSSDRQSLVEVLGLNRERFMIPP